MKRFKITNHKSGLSFQVERDELGEHQPEWGRHEREVTADQEDVSGAISSRTETDKLTGEERTIYTLPAEYTVEVVDLTQDPAWVEEQFRQEREREYAKEGVTEKAMIVALWEKLVEGRPEAADALQVKRANVKARVPKK